MRITGLGAAGIAVLAVVCCAGLPLIAAAGLSAAAFAWIGGIAVGIAAFAVAFVILVVRARWGIASCHTPSLTSTKETANGARLLRVAQGERRSYSRNG